MPDPSIFPALRAALRYNEIGDGNPYRLSYARLGSSGASFGIFQADTHTNPAAIAALIKILGAAGFEPNRLASVIDVLRQSCPNGSPLSAEDDADVDAALSSAAGVEVVDGLDGQTFQIVCSELDACIAAATPAIITGHALCAIGCWVNMTGKPTTLLASLRGWATAVPTITLAQINRYLQGELYFRLNPRDWQHFADSVAAGAALLPGAPAPAAVS